MKYFLGIDGGGTKTAFLLVDAHGRECASITADGGSWRDLGLESVLNNIRENVTSCLIQAGISGHEVCGAAIGLPCFGESPMEDQNIEKRVKDLFPEFPIYITNDVEVGWAGSLGLAPGINIVAGTGSIAFGRNDSGETARSGGWSCFFGDEGSCYQLGRKTMELFSKQADGRIPKNKLYNLIIETFKLTNDFDFIDIMEQEYVGNRSKVASLQKILLQAAESGDESAIHLYQEAAGELALMIESVARKLSMTGKTLPVSWSGGLFHARKFVLPWLEQSVSMLGGSMAEPKFLPVQGAVLLSAEKYAAELLPDILRGLSEWRKAGSNWFVSG